MAKDLRFNVEARQLLEAGVNALADAIKITLGPKGRNAVIEKLTGPPTITNDGVTIAREIQLRDPFANMGAQLVKEVAMKTNGVAGDGTTTATVLAQALVREGLLAVDAGANPMQLRRGIEVSIAAVVAALNSRASVIGGPSDLMHVATLSASDDTQIGKVVSDALGRVGTTGVVTVEESPAYGLSLTMVDGVEFDHGYISPYMVTDKERMEAVFENPYILLSNKKITQVQDLMPTLELVMRSGTGRALVILAENVEGAALSMLVSNNVHNTFRSVVVRAPGFGHRRVAELEDLAALLGGEVVSDDSGLTLANLKISDLGSCAKITISENGTTMVGGEGSQSDVAARLTQLERELERTENEHDRDNLQLRIARLSDRVAVIHVGAATGVELKEKLHRVEDAVEATRAALEEGVIAGGGTSLIHARDALDDVELTGDAEQGREVVRRSLSEPLRWIAINAGYDGPEVIRIVSELPLGQGFNALTGEYGDMFDFGVIDPLKVTRTALESAASIAALLITTETAIVEEVLGNPGAIMAPGFGDLAEGMVRPSNIY
jgi:chaperonin GroEL